LTDILIEAVRMAMNVVDQPALAVSRDAGVESSTIVTHVTTL